MTKFSSDDGSLADALAAASARGQQHYSATDLASDVSPVVGRIGRRRTARLAGIGAVALAAASALGLGAVAVLPTSEPGGPTPTASVEPPQPPRTDETAATGRVACQQGNFGDSADYPNGEFPEDALCTLWNGTSQLQLEAGALLWWVNDEYHAEFGEDLCIENSYLSLADRAAIGDEGEADTSAHGLGAAIDLCEGQDEGESFEWLTDHGLAAGWHNPEWKSAEPSEPWHWEFLPGLGDILQPVVIAEGATFGDIIRAMHRSQGIGGGATMETVERVTLEVLNDRHNGAFGNSIEGWIAPGSYPLDDLLDGGFSLELVADARYDHLVSLGVAPEDMVRVLTIASIVEKEAVRDEDRAVIAGVIENRLAAGMPLGLSSTTAYADLLNLTARTDAERAANLAYDTFRVKGLPPGPIASPTNASIAAALSPATHDYLYFVMVNPDTGEIRYSASEEEHAIDVDLYLEWVEANGS